MTCNQHEMISYQKFPQLKFPHIRNLYQKFPQLNLDGSFIPIGKKLRMILDFMFKDLTGDNIFDMFCSILSWFNKFDGKCGKSVGCIMVFVLRIFINVFCFCLQFYLNLLHPEKVDFFLVPWENRAVEVWGLDCLPWVEGNWFQLIFYRTF